MTVTPELDARFRAAAVAEGLVDAAYDVFESPLGPLLVATTRNGLCRIAYDAEPEREEERLARGYGFRVLYSPPALDAAKRELAAYFEGRQYSFGLSLDLRVLGAFHRDVLERLAAVPYGQLTTYGTLAAAAGRPRAARAVGTVMNRNPLPIVLPCHRVVGSTGKLVGYAGGLERKRKLLELEGALSSA